MSSEGFINAQSGDPASGSRLSLHRVWPQVLRVYLTALSRELKLHRQCPGVQPGLLPLHLQREGVASRAFKLQAV